MPASFPLPAEHRCVSEQVQVQKETCVQTGDNLRRVGTEKQQTTVRINNKETSVLEQKKPLRCYTRIAKPIAVTQIGESRNAMTPTLRNKYIK